MNQSEVCDDIDNNCDWNGLEWSIMGAREVYSQCSLSDIFMKCPGCDSTSLSLAQATSPSFPTVLSTSNRPYLTHCLAWLNKHNLVCLQEYICNFHNRSLPAFISFQAAARWSLPCTGQYWSGILCHGTVPESCRIVSSNLISHAMYITHHMYGPGMTIYMDFIVDLPNHLCLY